MPLPVSSVSCCRDKKIFQENFHQVYHGFNEDIWEDFFGGQESDPCCKPQPTCGNGNGSNVNGPRPCPPPRNACCCSCSGSPQNETSNNNAMSRNQTKRDTSCCATKNEFKSEQIYVGFNEAVFGKLAGCQP